MADVVERLERRAWEYEQYHADGKKEGALLIEAAKEIERLRRALEPFAEFARLLAIGNFAPDEEIFNATSGGIKTKVTTAARFYAARSALKPTEKE